MSEICWPWFLIVFQNYGTPFGQEYLWDGAELHLTACSQLDSICRSVKLQHHCPHWNKSKKTIHYNEYVANDSKSTVQFPKCTYYIFPLTGMPYKTKTWLSQFRPAKMSKRDAAEFRFWSPHFNLIVWPFQDESNNMYGRPPSCTGYQLTRHRLTVCHNRIEQRNTNMTEPTIQNLWRH